MPSPSFFGLAIEIEVWVALTYSRFTEAVPRHPGPILERIAALASPR